MNRRGLFRTRSEGAGLMHQVLGRLSDRDRLIVRLLYRHRVLTTQQVCAAAFPSVRRAEMRMRDLHEIRVVDRFRPLVATGSAPYHWVLDEVGAYVAAWECGLDLAKSGWRRDRALSVAASPQLGHLLGVNSFFIALMREARERPGRRLAEWLSSAQCAAVHDSLYSGRIRPDGYAVWAEGGVRLPFFVEYDCGTERLERLRDKLRGYDTLVQWMDKWPDQYGEDGGRPYARLVLFVFRTAGRELEARRAFGDPPVCVATAVIPEGAECNPAAETVWSPAVPGTARRLRLVELATRQAWQPGVPVAPPDEPRRRRHIDHPADAALAAYFGEDDDHPAAAGAGSGETEAW